MLLCENGGMETEKKTIKRFPIWRILFFMLTLIALSYLLYRCTLKYKLNRRLEAMRASGYPATLEELDEWYSIDPNVENAADIILEALTFYDNNSVKDKNLPFISNQQNAPHLSDPLSEKTMAAFTEYLDINKKTLELLHKGARIEHARYPIDLTQGLLMEVHYLSDLKKSVNLLQIEALVHAEKQQPDSAIKSVETIFGIAHSLSKEPTLVSQLVKIGSYTIAIQTVERLINRVVLSNEHLVKLADILQTHKSEISLRYGLIGERCVSLALLQLPFKETMTILQQSSSEEGEVFVIPGIFIYRFTGLNDWSAILLSDYLTECIDGYNLSAHERLKTVQSANNRAEEVSLIHILFHLLRPALAKCVEYDLRTLSNLRACHTAIITELYRLEKGSLPETLSDLVPDYLESIPIDPFDGNDLRYKKKKVGYIIYSVGEDGVDDGGVDKFSVGKHDTYDWPFTVEK